MTHVIAQKPNFPHYTEEGIKGFQPAFVSSSAHPGVCLTEPCITVASAVMSALDRSVDPCHDFYSYACGGWMNNNPLPEGKSRWGSFSKLWERNMLVMKQLLGEYRRS